MAFDDVILHIGEFGRYQRRIYFLLCLPVIVCSFHVMGTPFFGLTVNTRCMLANETAKNASYQMSDDLMNSIYILKNKSGFVQACEIRTNFSIDEFSIASNTTGNSERSKYCEKFVYDTSVFKSTTSTEWDLVCDRSWLKTIGDSSLLVGVMIGALFFGALSDKFGRRPTLFLSLFIQLIGGLLVAVAPNYTFYIIARIIVGLSCNGVFLVTFVMAMELVGPTKRGAAGVCFQFFWCFGYILVCGLAYVLPSWRRLQIAITLPSFAFIIYWWLVPESLRWMMTSKKVEEAKNLLLRAAKKNGKEISRDNLDRIINDNVKSIGSIVPDETSILDLFRYPNLRKKIIFLSINWFAASGIYYRMSWDAVTLGGNVYINHLTSGLVEIPVLVFIVWSLHRWGRKPILSCSLFVAGVALILTAFVPEEYPITNMIMFMIGKAAISHCFGIIFIYTVEMIPTGVRNIGLGTCATSGKIGGIISPLVNHTADIWQPLPFIVIGLLALFCSAITLLLPETLGEKLPETIMEGESYTGIKQVDERENRLEIELESNAFITPKRLS